MQSPNGHARGARWAALVLVGGVGAVARADAPAQETAPTSVAAHAAPHAPAPAQVLGGRHDSYRPLATFTSRSWSLQVPLLLQGRVEGVSELDVDRDGNRYSSGAVLSPMVRLGVRLKTVKPLAGKLIVLAEYEHDLSTGAWVSERTLDGVGLPNFAEVTTQLRKGYGRLSLGPLVHLGGGFMTSHWGLGLLANDGAHGWEPGSARFSDPRGGDRVLRGFFGTGPLSRARVVGTVAVDQLRGDDVLLDGDSGLQLIASALAGYGRATRGGFFLVHRRQRSADGHELNVTAIDLAGHLAFDLARARLTLEGELAVIAGNTTLAPTTDYSRHDVLQIGAALRGSVAVGRVGGVLDLLYASGDQNHYDERVSGFKADPNYETGLLLFRYAQAAQTGRAAVTAADPLLVGEPAQNLERVPTRGSVSNAVVLFPRVWVRPLAGLEAYGGPLFAFAPAKNLDPLNTRLAGGAPRNALDGAPGGYWGTEIDLGLKYRALLHGTELTVGAEGAVFFAGSAFRDAAGELPDTAFGGRLMLAYRP